MTILGIPVGIVITALFLLVGFGTFIYSAFAFVDSLFNRLKIVEYSVSFVGESIDKKMVIFVAVSFQVPLFKRTPIDFGTTVTMLLTGWIKTDLESHKSEDLLRFASLSRNMLRELKSLAESHNLKIHEIEYFPLVKV